MIKTQKQKEAIELIKKNRFTLLEGGARSGKTLIILYAMCVRALKYANTWHLAVRLRFNHARTSLWQKSIPDILRFMKLEKIGHPNNTDCFWEFPNNSRVMVSGLDDKDRVEKILGNEYATIFLNEASQIAFDSFEIVRTRLNASKGMTTRFLIDYNPPSHKHWGFQIFHNRQFPDGRPVPDNDYGYMRINPEDNKENLSDDYINQLQELTGRKRQRFYFGEYTEDEGTLWKREWFKYEISPKDMERVVIGVDPSGSKLGDEIGIVAVGKKENKYFVLDDYSLHGTPNEWSTEVITAYNHHKADIIAAEKNFGGDMVEATITQFGKHFLNVKLVSASRGKMVRAEPVASLYEKGLVYHVKELYELEDELCSARFENTQEKDNRLDALVWAITELASESEINIRWV